ncbi:MAG: hypothetical protein HQM16_10150 [Deltaproteobacteria bacterium]|nr:hypothetical protein [Deltaproteobacteria bacterium]
MLYALIIIALIIAVIILFGQVKKLKKRLDTGTMGADKKKGFGEADATKV